MYGRKIGFNAAIRIGLPLLFSLGLSRAFAQEKPIEGIVFDKDTKERVARTNIVNETTGKSYYDDLKGEFKIDARVGDQLIFNKDEYYPDTIMVKNTGSLLVYLHRKAIPLREVTVRDTLHTPLQRLNATKREYSKAYQSGMYNNPLSSVPGGGAGLNLDALFYSLSRTGRNELHLQELIQQDYEQNVIDYRFNKSYVGTITKLQDPDLTDFMKLYRPSYYRVTTDSEYEFISYIRLSLKRYLRNKRIFSHPAVTPPGGS